MNIFPTAHSLACVAQAVCYAGAGEVMEALTTLPEQEFDSPAAIFKAVGNEEEAAASTAPGNCSTRAA